MATAGETNDARQAGMVAVQIFKIRHPPRAKRNDFQVNIIESEGFDIITSSEEDS